MRKITLTLMTIACSLTLLMSCRDDLLIFPSEEVVVEPPAVIEPPEDPEDPNVVIPDIPIEGFYLLNEGNMGMNRASLDFMSYRTGKYTVDIYSMQNPNVVKELGDVGNDLKIYGNKLYAVINCSNKIEVMDKRTAKRIKKIDVPNCRYLAFNGDKAYISSYSGPVAIDPNAEKGFVAEIDTTTLELKRVAAVGYQPEEMVVHDGKMYVANSGGYRVPDYDRTISVIDLVSFKEIKKIDVGINLHRIQIDKRGDLYVSSRGDYYTIPSKLFVIDTKTDKVKKTLDIPVSQMTMVGDSLYYYSTEWSYNTNSNKITYGILDTRTQRVVNDRIITDGTDSQIMIPYGIHVNPITRDIYITDAQNYVVTGYVYCFNKEGVLKWRVLAGNIPGHFAFLYN